MINFGSYDPNCVVNYAKNISGHNRKYRTTAMIVIADMHCVQFMMLRQIYAVSSYKTVHASVQCFINYRNQAVSQIWVSLFWCVFLRSTDLSLRLPILGRSIAPLPKKNSVGRYILFNPTSVFVCHIGIIKVANKKKNYKLGWPLMSHCSWHLS